MNILSVLLMLIISMMSLLCMSCQWLINSGTETKDSPELLWKSQLSAGEYIEGVIPPVAHETGVLTIGSVNTLPVLYFLDRNTGKVLWTWQEFFKRNESVLVYRIYKYQNIAVINNSPLMYAIDLGTGNTVWVNSQSKRNRAWVNGYGNLFLGAVDTNLVTIGSIRNGNQSLINIHMDKVSFTPPQMYIDSITLDTMLVVTGSNTYKDSTYQFYFKNYLVLYNLTKKSIEYQTLIREGYSTAESGLGGVGRECVIYNGRVYIDIGKSIQCHDIKTGKLIWKQTFTSNFYIASILEADGKIIGNGDDEGIMYALDPTLGSIIWQSKTTTSASSLLFYMNGIVYMTGSGDGRLYAIDVKTGKFIWKHSCPDENGKPGSFTGTVTGDKDRVYVNSFLNIYCYKAAK